MINKLEQFAELLSDRGEREYENWFDEIADTLMNHLCIEVGQSKYRITECEFYYNDGDEINGYADPYIHFGEEQLTLGSLYFNKAGGLDLTFGNLKNKIYAGILIRGINKIGTTEYINQITKVTEEIFRSLGNIIIEKNTVSLKETILNEIQIPIKTKRVRLNFRGDDKKDFFNRRYRYIIELKPSQKFFDKESVVRELLKLNENLHKDPKEILGYELPKKSQ